MVCSKTLKTSFSKLLQHRLNLTTENMWIFLKGHYTLIGRNMSRKFQIPLTIMLIYHSVKIGLPLIGCWLLSQEYCKEIGWYWKIWRKQHLNTPYSYMGDIREFNFVNFCKLPGDIILGLFYVQTVNQHQIKTKNRSTSVDNCTFSWFFTSSVVLTTSSSEISFFFVCSLSSYFDYKEIQRQRIKITLWKYSQNLAAWL